MLPDKIKPMKASATCGMCVKAVIKIVNNEHKMICTLHSYYSPFEINPKLPALCTGFKSK